MGHFIHFLAISFGWSLLFCDAIVTVSLINGANGNDTLECNSHGVVSCHINPYENLSSWEINGQPYAMCTTDCIEVSNFPRNYSFTHDVINGVFNLTVDSVTFNDSGTTFKCDDGYTFDSITIEVVPAYSENRTSISDKDGGKQVEFTTACVQSDVEFDWFTVKTYNSDRERYTFGQNEMTGECSHDLECGGAGTVNVTSFIMIPTVQFFLLKEERYLEVDVKYKNPKGLRTFRFEEKFQFEDCKLRCRFIIFLIYSVRLILLLALYFVGSLCGFWKRGLQKTIMIVIGNIPIFGPCCSAFLFFRKIKEKRVLTNWLIVFGFFDICIFVVMILTCSDVIKVKCLIYAVYALVTLPFPVIYCICLKKYMKTHTDLVSYFSNLQCNNRTTSEPDECIGEYMEANMAKDMIVYDTCMITHRRNKTETYCLKCQQYLCKNCLQKHYKHKILRHSDKAPDETLCQIFCNPCQNNDIKAEGKYCSNADKRFIVCEDCKSERGLKNFIALDDMYFHSETNVESYCLSCQQYLCSLCFTKHAKHKILRHYQRGAGKARCQILCKFCQNMSIKSYAIYYCKSTGVKSFVCEDCKTTRRLKNTIAIDDPKWQCNRCEYNDDPTIHPAECYCMIYDVNMCVVCFEKIREQSLLLKRSIETRKSEQINVCALHSVARLPERKRTTLQLNDANESPADVLCLVCDEYMCKRCFKQHLNLKHLWRQHHPGQESAESQSSSFSSSSSSSSVQVYRKRIQTRNERR